MNDDPANKKMDRNNFYLIRHALLINLAVTALLGIILYMLKLENEPILELLIKYYLN
jgi:hypothetical protein